MRTCALVLAVLVVTGAPAAAQLTGAPVPALGYLANEPTPESVPVLRQALADLGWHEGRTLRAWYRYAQGKPPLFSTHAEELVRLGATVLVAATPAAVAAARQASRHIPIVMVSTDDPLRRGFVSSLETPGGNVTGITTFVPAASTRRLELLQQLVPTLTRVAVLWNPTNPSAAWDLEMTQIAARARGVAVTPIEARSNSKLRAALAAVEQARPDGLLVLTDALFVADRRQIARFAERRRLPAVYPLPEFAEVGGLVAYGVGWPDTFRRAAVFVDKLLRGAHPGDLPVERPRRLELVVNLRAAHTLRLPIPSSLLQAAERVLQ